MVGLGTFTAASFAAGLATADSFLIAMRAVQGMGAAIVLPAALSIVMNMFEEGAARNGSYPLMRSTSSRTDWARPTNATAAPACPPM